MKHHLNSFRLWAEKEWHWMSYLAVFVLSFVLLLLFQANTVFADPDSFYHAKMALLMREQGIISEFPWLQLTTLGQHYTNQHLLYHALLIPFETALPPLLGLKLATVFFGSAFMTCFYWFMRSFQVRWPFFFFLLLLLSRPLTFRMSLAKAPSTALIFLLLGLAYVFRFQIKRAAILAFTYVWYYGGFPLLGVGTAIYAAVSAMYNRLHKRTRSHQLIHNVLALASKRTLGRSYLSRNWAILLAVGAGLTAGIVLNPYFPDNLYFYWEQTVNIGIINFQKVIGVGAEWYPYGFSALAVNAAFASLLLLVSVVAIIFRAKHLSKQTITLLLLTAFFFVLTLKSRRYIEYYVPFAILASAFTISDSLASDHGRAFLKELRRLIFHNRATKFFAGFLLIYLLAGAGYIAGRDVSGQLRDLRSGYPLTRFQKVGEWMQANTPPGARIVHSDWDEFPPLFYYNSHNTYIVGLDPTFFYKANPDLYDLWVNITLGRFSGDLHQAVTERLGAKYVLVAKNHEAMRSLVLNDGRFIEMYRDAEATVYAPELQE